MSETKTPALNPTSLVEVLGGIAELLRGSHTPETFRDAMANLLFFKWVDEEADANQKFEESVFALQARRFRWEAALEQPAASFNAFLYDEVYPFLGSLDRVAPHVAFFFRFTCPLIAAPSLRPVAVALNDLKVHGLSPTEAAALVDGLLPSERGAPIRTPVAVRRLLVELLDVRRGDRVLDLACGSGGLLHDIAIRVGREGGALASAVGLEIQAQALKFARLRFLLSGLPVPDFRHGDALTEDTLADVELENFDVVVCDPPLGIQRNTSRFGRFFETPSNRSEHLFLQLAMAAGTAQGRSAILLPPAFVSGSDRASLELRETLFDTFTTDAIFALPAGFIPGVSIAMYAVLFRSNQVEPEARPSRLFVFDPVGTHDDPERYVTSALEAWRLATEGQDGAGRWIRWDELRDNQFDIAKSRPRAAQADAEPEDLAGQLALADVQLERVRLVVQRLRDVQSVRAESVRLELLGRRFRAERFADPSAWLLTQDQIEPRTGRILAKRRGDSERQTSGLVPFEAGNVLISRLNPKLGKIIVADERGYCVPDFVPFSVDTTRALPAFVAASMRAPGFLGSLVRMAEGTIRPRVAFERVLQLTIPLPSLSDQARVVDELAIVTTGVLEVHALRVTLENLVGPLHSLILPTGPEGQDP